MEFNAKLDPKEGYDKWKGEYFRLESAILHKGSDKRLWDQQEDAKKYMNYFSRLLKGGKAKEPEYRGEKVKIPKGTPEPDKKKKWPGWDKVLDKL